VIGERKRRWVSPLLVGLAAACLFFGFWAFVYHGYEEDAGTGRVYSWPYGAALFAAALLLITLAIRWKHPGLHAGRLAQIVLALVALLVLAALGSLDAGGNSFEF
jgi:hypothetical protein